MQFPARLFLATLATLWISGCYGSPASDDHVGGGDGKADGFGDDQPVNRGPGCAVIDTASYDYLVAKLHDDLGVRQNAAGQFELVAPLSEATEEELTTALFDIFDTLEQFGRQVPDDIRMVFSPNRMKVIDRAPTAERVADLGAYYAVRTGGLDLAAIESLCEALVASPVVELAYPQPRPEPATVADEGIDLTTDPAYVQFYSDYLAAASEGGFGSRPVRELPGARGAGIRVVDIEFGAALGHEDFPAIEFVAGDPNAFNDHGTAVLGVIGAQENGFGATGFVPEATLGSAAFTSDGTDWTQTTAELILAAADWAGPNGVILIEMHAPAAVRQADCACNFAQCDYVAVEYFPAIFDAIRTATANGVHVFEAAGNGSVNLDRLLPDRRVLDSGAVLVGASLSTARAPACFSNHGEVVDLHGWGENVLTTGYGNHPVHQTIPVESSEDSYTHTFSGTSSASPMVVGSAASVLGLAAANLGEQLRPSDLRALLIRSGSSQTETAPPNRPAQFWLIGPQPDIASAWTQFQQLVPIADFSAQQTAPLTVQLTNESTARSDLFEAEIARAEWDFGDGHASSAFSPSHQYASAGDYEVTLTVFTRDGHLRSVARTVTVAGDVDTGRDQAVLDLVNTASFETLDEEVALDSRAAQNIVEQRPFATIAELDAVPWVGPVTLEKLYAFVE